MLNYTRKSRARYDNTANLSRNRNYRQEARVNKTSKQQQMPSLWGSISSWSFKVMQSNGTNLF